MKHYLLAALVAIIALSPVSRAQHQARRGSIYTASGGPVGLIADKTAARAGDLVTILISETSDVTEESKSDFSRASGLGYSLDTFDIKPNAFNFLPGIASSTTDDFSGNAKQEKKGTFTARLTAIVTDALPNGNLVIRGRREIRVDKQVKTIEFSGIVRRYDVRADNTVTSELVAEAKIAYTGTGPGTEATTRPGLGGLIHSAIVWLWPF
jgi:flagellar L-ring protein FlgH